MDKVTILDREFDIDMFDAETAGCVEQAQAAFEAADAGAQAVLEEQGLKAYIEYVCHNVFEFFNTIFGEGTDTAIFGGRCNLGDAAEAIAQFRAYVDQGSRAAMETRLRKYMPNRQTRRTTLK